MRPPPLSVKPGPCPELAKGRPFVAASARESSRQPARRLPSHPRHHPPQPGPRALRGGPAEWQKGHLPSFPGAGGEPSGLGRRSLSPAGAQPLRSRPGADRRGSGVAEGLRPSGKGRGPKPRDCPTVKRIARSGHPSPLRSACLEEFRRSGWITRPPGTTQPFRYEASSLCMPRTGPSRIKMKRPDRLAPGKTQKPEKLLNRAAYYCRDAEGLLPKTEPVKTFPKLSRIFFRSRIQDRWAHLSPWPIPRCFVRKPLHAATQDRQAPCREPR